MGHRGPGRRTRRQSAEIRNTARYGRRPHAWHLDTGDAWCEQGAGGLDLVGIHALGASGLASTGTCGVAGGLGALLFAIQVHPVGKGRRVLTVEATEGTVTMDCRRVERRLSLETGATTRTPKVPDAGKAIVRAPNS